MPDGQRGSQLRQFDQDTRTGKAPWRDYATLRGFVVIAIVIALAFLRNVSASLSSDAASSVSNAAG